MDLWQTKESIEQYKLALTSLEHLKSRSSRKAVERRGFLLQNLASAYVRLYQFDNAKKFYDEAVEIYKKEPISERAALGITNNMALFFLEAGCLSAAEMYANHVQDRLTGNDNEKHPLRAFTLLTLTGARLAHGDKKGALEIASMARDSIISAFGAQHWRLAQVKTIEAEALLYQNNRDLSHATIQEALSVLEKRGKEPLVQYITTLAMAARTIAQDNPDSALKQIKVAESYLDSLRAECVQELIG